MKQYQYEIKVNVLGITFVCDVNYEHEEEWVDTNTGGTQKQVYYAIDFELVSCPDVPEIDLGYFEDNFNDEMYEQCLDTARAMYEEQTRMVA